MAAHPHLCKSFGWCVKPFCSSALHTSVRHTFQTSPENMPELHLDTFACVKFVICLGKGECMRSCTPVEAALDQELAQTYAGISTSTTISTTQTESENTASFMHCLGSLVISQIIIPPYLLEEFGRKRRDCWKLAFKSGFPWERWSCSEVCGITW